MFWFFGKKEDREAHKKIDSLHNSVSSSFKNIKRDMVSVSSWLKHLKESHSDHDQRIEAIETQLSHISKKLEMHHEIINSHSASLELVSLGQEEPEQADALEVPSGTDRADIQSLLKGLTETQKLMFIKLISLQRESGGWVPFKVLAEELYPCKGYSDVRSTISEYLTLLSEFGLVAKKRTGKQSLVQVTEKGQDLINSFKTESKRQDKIAIKRRR